MKPSEEEINVIRQQKAMNKSAEKLQELLDYKLPPICGFIIKEERDQYGQWISDEKCLFIPIKWLNLRTNKFEYGRRCRYHLTEE